MPDGPTTPEGADKPRVERKASPEKRETRTRGGVLEAYITSVSLLRNAAKSEELSKEEQWAEQALVGFNDKTLDRGKLKDGKPLLLDVDFNYVEADGKITKYTGREGPPVDVLIGFLDKKMSIAHNNGDNAEYENYKRLHDTILENSWGYFDPRNPNFRRSVREDDVSRDDRGFRRARTQHEAYLVSQDQRKGETPLDNWDTAQKEMGLGRMELVLPGDEYLTEEETESTEEEKPEDKTKAKADGEDKGEGKDKTHEEKVPPPPPPEPPTYNVGVARGDEIYRIRAYEEADKQLRELLRKGSFLKFFRKMAIRTAYPYFRQKLAKRAEDIMRENNNPFGEYNLAKSTAFNLFSKAEVVNAEKGREEFEKSQQATVESAVFLGSTGEKFEGQQGVEIKDTLKKKFEDDILLKIAKGEIKDKEGVQDALIDFVDENMDNKMVEELFGASGSDFGKVVDAFATNIFEVGQAMGEDLKAHKYSEAELDKFVKVYFGNIKEGADTQLRTKVDGVLRRLQSLHLGPFAVGGAIANPAVIGAAGALTGFLGARGLGSSVGLATGAIPLGGILTGSTFAAWRAGGEAKEDVIVHGRETAQGMSTEPGAKRRAELDKIIEKLGRAKPTQLLEGGGDELLLSGISRISVEAMKSLNISDGQEGNRDILRRRWAEIQARLDMGDSNRVDYITYSDSRGTDITPERLALMKAAHDIKELLTKAGDTEVDKFLTQSKEKLMANKEAQDQEEQAYIKRRRIRAAVTGGIVGFASGIAVREGLALDDMTGGHVVGAIREHLPSFLGGRAATPEVPTQASAHATSELAHSGGGGKPMAELHSTAQTETPSPQNLEQPSHSESILINETKPVSGPNVEWAKHTTNIDERIWEKGDDQLLHTIKQGDKLILDISRMHLKAGEAGFAFTTPDNQTVIVPPELVKDNQLILDPNNFKDFVTTPSGGKLSIGELDRMVVNHDALAQRPDGDIATELTGHREVFNVKFIEAAKVDNVGGKNVEHIMATIQGSHEMPKTVEVPPATPQPPGPETPKPIPTPGPTTETPKPIPTPGPNTPETPKPIPTPGPTTETPRPIPTPGPETTTPTPTPGPDTIQTPKPIPTPGPGSPTPTPSPSPTPGPETAVPSPRPPDGAPGGTPRPGIGDLLFNLEPAVPIVEDSRGLPEEMKGKELSEGDKTKKPKEGGKDGEEERKPELVSKEPVVFDEKGKIVAHNKEKVVEEEPREEGELKSGDRLIDEDGKLFTVSSLDDKEDKIGLLADGEEESKEFSLSDLRKRLADEKSGWKIILPEPEPPAPIVEEEPPAEEPPAEPPEPAERKPTILETPIREEGKEEIEEGEKKKTPEKPPEPGVEEGARVEERVVPTDTPPASAATGGPVAPAPEPTPSVLESATSTETAEKDEIPAGTFMTSEPEAVSASKTPVPSVPEVTPLPATPAVEEAIAKIQELSDDEARQQLTKLLFGQIDPEMPIARVRTRLEQIVSQAVSLAKSVTAETATAGLRELPPTHPATEESFEEEETATETEAPVEEDPVDKILNMSSYDVEKIGKEEYGGAWNGSISKLRAQLIREAMIKPTAYERGMWGDKAEEMVRLRNMNNEQIMQEALRVFGQIENKPIEQMRFALENRIIPVKKPEILEETVENKSQGEREETKKLDAIIVLGKNIGVDWKPQNIRESIHQLSPHSRLSVLAAGLLYKAGYTDKIIISTGYTAGKGLTTREKPVLSEAQAMKNRLLEVFPDIPENAIELDEESLDTRGNAEKVKEILKKRGWKNVGLLTVGFHMDRAKMLFAKQGIKAKPFASEEVLRDRRTRFVEQYLKSELVQKEIKKEKTAKLIQSVPLGPQLLRLVVNLTRGEGKIKLPADKKSEEKAEKTTEKGKKETKGEKRKRKQQEKEEERVKKEIKKSIKDIRKKYPKIPDDETALSLLREGIIPKEFK